MQHVSMLLFLGLGFGIIGVSEASFCPLPWKLTKTSNATCPYGYALPLVDVTVPNNATWIDWVCVFYGIIPFVIIGCASLETVVRAFFMRGLGTRETSFLLFVLMQVLLGEFFFKQLATQSRPDTTCATTCGMPSSHTTMSVGFFMLLFLDAVHRVMPTFPRDLANAQMYLRSEPAICCGNSKGDLIRSLPGMLNFIPITDYHTLTHHNFSVSVCVWGILLLPVGFTRTALNDHTPAQVTIGAIIGFCEAIAFFAFSRYVLQKKLQPRIGTRLLFVFIHNYAVPVFEAVGNGWNLLAELDEYELEGEAEGEAVENLLAVRREVTYYTEQSNPCLPALMLDKEKPAVQYQLKLLHKMDDAVKLKLKEFGHEGNLDGLLEEVGDDET